MTDVLGIKTRKTKLLTDLEKNPHLAGAIIYGFIQACLPQVKSILDIQPVILEAIKQNPDLAFDIIDSFTRLCLSQSQSISDIQPVILAILQIDAVKQNLNLAFKIIDAFTQACLAKAQSILNIQSVILASLQIDAVKQNPNLAYAIIFGFTQACLCQNKPIKDDTNPENDIQSVILVVLQTDTVKQNPNLAFKIIDGFTQACLFKSKLISEIQSVIVEAIKQNPNLAFDIIDGFIKVCLSKGKIKELIPVFQNLLEEIQKPEFSAKNKSLLINQIKSISILILSQYLQDTLLTLKDKSSLSKKDKDISVENELLGLFKSLYPEVFKDIDKFEDVKLKDLIPIWQIFFVSKIKIQTINGGKLYEILPFIFDIFKDNKDLTIGQFIEQTKALLQNFYYIDLNYKKGKEQLKKIKEESEKPENKDKPFIVYTVFPNHGVISIIQNGQISIIDSSRAIFHPERLQYQQILRDCGFKDSNISYFNTTPYQENGTCYLDAILALKWIMEEFLSQQKDKKPEDTSTTLNSILDGLKQQTGISLKSIPSISSRYREANLQQIVVDVVSQLVKFYETLQQPITERYIADVKVLEKDASATATATTEPKTEFTDIGGGTTPPSSKTSEEAANDRAKENLQEKLKLGEITQEILAIKPQIIATIIANTSIASQLAAEFAIISRIFGAIPEVRKNVAAIQKAQQAAAKLQPTTTLRYMAA